MKPLRTIDRVLDRAFDVAVVPGFSRIGHAVRSRSWADLPPGALDGRTVVVTGATSGLGKAAAMRMAGLGGSIVIAGRDPVRLDSVVEAIRSSGGAARSERADLSLMADIRALAARLLDRESSIHVLVNNVGVLLPERSETTEGIERTLATNLAGHFLLTNLLIPRLVQSAPSRIINVSSGGMYARGLDVDDLQSERGYRGAVAYARTKRGQVALTEEWAERLRGTGVSVHAMHPGWADTPGVRASLPAFRAVTRPVLRTPEQGADTIVWLVAADEAAASSGGFWHDRRKRPTDRLPATAVTRAERQRLWNELADLVERTDGSTTTNAGGPGRPRREEDQ